MCSDDQQISKIVKGDNIKSIDTILQSQDINPQNSSEIDQEVGTSSAKNLTLKTQNNPLLSGQNKSNTNVNTNLFGVPPKKDSNPPLNTTNNKPNISSTTKADLFGPNPTNKNTTSKANNLFGTNTSNNLFGTTTNTNKTAAKNNLFGNTNTTNTNKTAAKNNLFGNTNTTNTKKTNNLFGTPNQQQNRNTNLFGNPKNETPQQQKTFKCKFKI